MKKILILAASMFVFHCHAMEKIWHYGSPDSPIRRTDKEEHLDIEKMTHSWDLYAQEHGITTQSTCTPSLKEVGSSSSADAQGGNHIGASFWKTLCNEHGITTQSEGADHNQPVHFSLDDDSDLDDDNQIDKELKWKRFVCNSVSQRIWESLSGDEKVFVLNAQWQALWNNDESLCLNLLFQDADEQVENQSGEDLQK